MHPTSARLPNSNQKPFPKHTKTSPQKFSTNPTKNSHNPKLYPTVFPLHPSTHLFLEIKANSREDKRKITWKPKGGRGGRSLRKSEGFLELRRISSSTNRSTSSLTLGWPQSSSMYGKASMNSAGREACGGASSIRMSPSFAIAAVVVELAQPSALTLVVWREDNACFIFIFS